jgi:hypothetical protein
MCTTSARKPCLFIHPYGLTLSINQDPGEHLILLGSSHGHGERRRTKKAHGPSLPRGLTRRPPRPWTVLRRPRRRLSIHPSCRSTCTTPAAWCPAGAGAGGEDSHAGASTHDAADMLSRSLSALMSQQSPRSLVVARDMHSPQEGHHASLRGLLRRYRCKRT